MTLTLAKIEINSFWDKIMKALNLENQNLVSKHIYLDPNSRYGVRQHHRQKTNLLWPLFDFGVSARGKHEGHP